MRPLLLVLVLFSSCAFGQAFKPLKSAAWKGPDVPCGAVAYAPDLMPIDQRGNWNTISADAGAGVWPVGVYLNVRKVCVTHGGMFARPAYAMAGHSGPNGDPVTPYNESNDGHPSCHDYDADAPIYFSPGEYFDVHAYCASGAHHVVLQIWFTQ